MENFYTLTFDLNKKEIPGKNLLEKLENLPSVVQQCVKKYSIQKPQKINGFETE